MYKNFCVKGNTSEQPFERMRQSAVETNTITYAKKLKDYFNNALHVQAYVCRAYYDNNGNLLGWKEWTK